MKKESKREKDSIKKKKDKKIFIKTSGKVMDGRVYEQVKDIGKDPEPFFVYYNRRKHEFEGKKSLKDGNLVFVPYTNNLIIIKNVVKIPTDIKENKDTDALISDIREFMDKYVYISDEVNKEIIITYILLTWVYDRFTAIPYLRAIGEYGTGKARLLHVLNICYKSITTSSLASPAPIFRVIDKFGGTLILDEAELGEKSDRNKDIKEILRAGKDYGGHILRCDPKTNQVIPFTVFGPKILGCRRPYIDDALETRIITIRMEEAKGNDIPINLEKEIFEKESDELRARLLAWRLKEYFNIDTNSYKKHILGDVSKRLNEMYSPLICVRAHDKDFIKSLLDKEVSSYKRQQEDKAMTIEANVVRVIVEIRFGIGGSVLLKEIVEKLNEGQNKDHSSRFIGGIIRNTLGLETKHARGGSKLVWDKSKIKKLVVDYNLKAELIPHIKRYNKLKEIQKKLKMNK